MKTGIIICSRLESSRLPNKAFLKIAGISAINHILNRVKPLKLPIIVATPLNQVDFYKNSLSGQSINICGGNDDSPLHRMADITRQWGFDWIIRITHDDILIDANTISEMIEKINENKEYGYGYFCSPGIFEGAGVEIISRENLLYAAEHRKEATEYVSYFVKGNTLPQKGIFNYSCRDGIRRKYRLTMDYPEDANLLNIILGKLGSDASNDKIISYLDRFPTLLNINKLPKISFYTCARNADRWIDETIASVKNCGLEDWEYIIVDDASTDETLTKAAAYLQDKRIKLISNPTNLGLSSSCNRALKYCRAPIIMRIDADDRLSSNFIDGFVDMYSKIEFGADIVYPAYSEINNDGFIIKNHVRGDANNHMGCAMIRKSVINELRFKEFIRNWEGLEIYTRLKDTAKIDYSDIVSWNYRFRPDSMSHTNLIEREIQKGKIMSKSEGIIK